MPTHAAARVIDRLRAAVPDARSDADLAGRYLLDRDEAAFTALVRRHGPMVLGVCRRVLRNEADAEDAFQATFLVLVRRAEVLRNPGRVANWLYGVAYRTARKARRASRRAAGISRLFDVAERAADAPRAAEASELSDILDAELAGLPDSYRLPIVLCDLQGRTIREVAGELGWPVGTVATRLTRGRARLAQRLLARGLGPTAATVAAGVPAALLTSTVHAATAFAAGSPGPAPAASHLAEGVLRAMTVRKLTVWAAAFVAATGVVAAGAWRFAPARAEPPPPAQKEVAAKADPAAGVVKGLEAAVWYPFRVDREGRTMDVCDAPQGQILWGGPDGPFPGVFVGPPSGPVLVKGLSVAKDATVTIDGKPGKLDDLPADAQLRLTFAARGLTVAAIEAKATPLPVLKAVDAAKGVVTVQLGKDGPPVELAVSPKASIYLWEKGNEGKLTDLVAGSRVTMTTAVEGGRLVVTDIRALMK